MGSRTITLTAQRPDLHWAGDLARMCQVSLIGFAVAGAFQNLAFFDLYFHLIAIVFLAPQAVITVLTAEGSIPHPSGARRRSPAFPGAPVPPRAAGPCSPSTGTCEFLPFGIAVVLCPPVPFLDDA